MSQRRQLDPGILREYDIRGIVGETLTPPDLELIGRGFATLVRRAGGRRVAVGYDGRLSSPELEASLVAGLNAGGVDALRVGLGPTPMLYYAAHVLTVDGGLMITGSHNPPEYNGIKLVLGGKSLYGEAIHALGRLCAEGELSAGAGTASAVAIGDRYIERLLQGFAGTRPLTVAWDPGNGASGDAVVQLARRLPGRHVLINERIDGRFPAHHPDPTVEKNLAQLKELVARERADVGIAFDGDGDRIGVVDARGRVLWGDQLLALLARDVLAARPGATIIADVKASQVLFDEIARLGGKPLMWRTGHSLIKAKMAELNAPLAGEMSGHIFFGHGYYGFDDALFAAMRLLSLLATGERTLDALRDALPAMLNTPEIRFPCAEADKARVIAEVRDRLAREKGVEVNDIDGVRVRTGDGWWLLRASNTQPVMVARCESATAAGLARLKAQLAEQLRRSGLEPPPLD